MKVNAPISLVTASYSAHDEAVADYQTVWGARHDDEFHHTALAVLTRDSGGALHVERNNSTAKHLVWGGALLGGALFVLAPTVGVEMLATVGLNGAGALIYHFRRNTDPAELAESADLLEDGASGLVVVVVNRRGAAMTPLLAHARRSSSVDMLWGDLEEELCRDFTTPLADSVLVAT
jgi:hypothetical protein